MNPFYPYFIMANLGLLIAWGAYVLVFKKSTDFRFVRFLLLGLILAALLIPLMPAQEWISSNDWNLKQAIAFDTTVDPVASTQIDSSGELIPSDLGQESILRSTTTPWPLLIMLLYLGITAFLLLRLLFNWRNLSKSLSKQKVKHFANYTLIETTEDIAPFSFFNKIVLNPDLYPAAQRALIMQHELAHVRQWHNLDILLAEMLKVLFWINPAVWNLRQIIRQNLEYLADEAVLKSGANPKIYQYSLLALKVPHFNHSALANHFNQSLLKKRIIMMNTKKSSDNTLLKSLFLIPVLALMVLVCQPVLAQKAGEKINSTSYPEDCEYFEEVPILKGEKIFGVIRADLSMEALQSMKTEFERRGIKLKYSNINFTQDGLLSSIRLEMITWGDNEPKILYMDNDGKAINETGTVYLVHEQGDCSIVTTGIGRIEPSELEFGEPALDKVTGLVVIDNNGKMYTKGTYTH